MQTLYITARFEHASRIEFNTEVAEGGFFFQFLHRSIEALSGVFTVRLERGTKPRIYIRKGTFELHASRYKFPVETGRELKTFEGAAYLS